MRTVTASERCWKRFSAHDQDQEKDQITKQGRWATGYDPAAQPAEDGDDGAQLQGGNNQLGRQDAIQGKADGSDEIADQDQHAAGGDENPALQFEMHHAEGVEHAACIDDVEQPPRKEDRYAGMAVAANEAGRWDVRYCSPLKGKRLLRA